MSLTGLGVACRLSPCWCASGLLALERGSKTILVVFLVGTIDPRDELSDLFSLLELLEVDRLLRCLVSLRSVVFVRISRLRDLGGGVFLFLSV